MRSLCLLLLAGTALAEEPETPDFRIAITSILAARYNPLGLEEQLRIGPQKRLYRNDKLVARDNFIFFGLATKLSPAFIKIGPSMDIQPLSVLNLRFTGELMGWFRSFNYLQSFNSPNADYSDSTLSRLKDSSYQSLGAHFTFEPTFQVKFGPVAFRNRFSVEYWRMNLRPGDTVFFDPTLDTLVPKSGIVLANDMDLLYLHPRKRFVVGLRYSLVQPIYQPGDYQPGEKQDNNNGHHRLGPLVAYTFFDRPYARFSKPSLILIVNWYVQSRWRDGADVSAGIPYLVLAFAFTSDLIPK
jgi:hypothetical protein